MLMIGRGTQLTFDLVEDDGARGLVAEPLQLPFPAPPVDRATLPARVSRWAIGVAALGLVGVAVMTSRADQAGTTAPARRLVLEQRDQEHPRSRIVHRE